MKDKLLKRYTNVPALLYLLKNRAITLLDPSSWDDRNDSYFLSLYKEKLKLKTVLALCFTEVGETYHHWRVFADGSSGVCITFRRDVLVNAVKKHTEIKTGSVQYVTFARLNKMALRIKSLPFIKRYGFQDESEFRIIYSSKQTIYSTRDIPVSLDCIEKISLNPWMPKPFFDSLKETIQAVDGCKHIKIIRSNLIDSAKWKKIGSSAK
ncbi:MAG TPA: hypothetical protein DCO77_03945 [Nitrospiraceae bacterium]|nr:hypothetical protein [Nitrospiraceae bacterium]